MDSEKYKWGQDGDRNFTVQYSEFCVRKSLSSFPALHLKTTGSC